MYSIPIITLDAYIIIIIIINIIVLKQYRIVY